MSICIHTHVSVCARVRGCVCVCVCVCVRARVRAPACTYYLLKLNRIWSLNGRILPLFLSKGALFCYDTYQGQQVRPTDLQLAMTRDDIPSMQELLTHWEDI